MKKLIALLVLALHIPLAGSDDWQVIDVQFPDFGGDTKSEMVDSLFEDAFVILGCGQVVGTTIGKPIWYKGSGTWVNASGQTV